MDDLQLQLQRPVLRSSVVQVDEARIANLSRAHEGRQAVSGEGNKKRKVRHEKLIANQVRESDGHAGSSSSSERMMIVSARRWQTDRQAAELS